MIDSVISRFFPVASLNLLSKMSPKEWMLTGLFMVFCIAYVFLTNTWPEMEWFAMLGSLFFGLVLFLVGMEEMEYALQVIAGSKMKLWLERFTVNRFAGMLTGAGVTSVIQSSSITTVLLVSFVSTGLMNLKRAIPVLFGANIGTTITAQIISFPVKKAALVMVVVGYIVKRLYAQNDKVSGFGSVVFGLGFIFAGMGAMSLAMHPLSDFQPFLDLMGEMSNPLMGLAVGAVFTALIQSSSAAMGVIISLASIGLINLEAGIVLAFGANIGTCVTAGLAAIGKPRVAVRVAVAHTVFNVMGAFMFIWFVPNIADFVEGTSGDLTRQVANAHSIFNILVGLVFLFVPTQLAKVVEYLVPDKPEEEEEPIAVPKYLLSVKEMANPMGSVLALEGIRKEIHRLGRKVVSMYQRILPAMLDGSRDDLKQVQGMDEEVNLLSHMILTNIRAMRRSLNLASESQMEEFGNLWSYPEAFESAADIIKLNLVKDGEDRIEKNVQVSDQTRAEIEKFHRVILKKSLLLLQVIEAEDSNLSAEESAEIEKKLRKIIKSRKKVRTLRHNIVSALQFARIDPGEDTHVTPYEVEADMVEHLFAFFEKILAIAKIERPHFESLVEQVEAEESANSKEVGGQDDTAVKNTT